jgi:uncharacterized membrane protein YjjB (DUF3815 family)
MNPLLSTLLHQAIFGGVAAAGFGVLFNCPPRMLGLCFGSGALVLFVRTAAQAGDWSLPAASFLAALSLGIADCTWLRAQSPRGSILAVVGCIPMVPGSLAAKALMGFFTLAHGLPDGSVTLLVVTMENTIVVVLTMVAIGIGLAIPALVYPHRAES